MKAQKSITPFRYIYPIITGGNVIINGNYKIHYFTTSGTFTVVRGGKIDFLLVAGGGGGGSANPGFGGGGGGGAGGLINVSGFLITSGIKSFTIGAGGIGAVYNGGPAATNGGNSSFDVYTAIGGGRGGYSPPAIGNATLGGSGGGAPFLGTVGAAGTVGQGNKGGDWSGTNGGAGGGGATGAGQPDFGTGSGGAGGTGYIFEGTEYAKGGNGGDQFNPSSAPPQNTGNGGPGEYAARMLNGYNGSDGILIIKYKFQ